MEFLRMSSVPHSTLLQNSCLTMFIPRGGLKINVIDAFVLFRLTKFKIFFADIFISVDIYF